ncbi:hypothetical protein PG985_010331 [Apiospora marii]|uniref:RRM domain-containing protein n=1 Tax=Apiospora marii TaxID=335849 RepID=A0ABR1RMW0_9PEZI
MPSYYTPDSARTGLPVLADKQRDEIRASFADDLQTALRDRLEAMANVWHQAGQPEHDLLTVRVLPTSETVTASTVRSWFTPYGSVIDFSMPLNADTGKIAGYAYVTFLETEDAEEALERYRAPENADKVRRIEFVETAPEFPRLRPEYPAAGEFEVADPLVRARVKLQEMEPDATYATVLVKTSWDLSKADKAKLEADKEYSLGSVVAPRVSIAYEMF